MSCMVSDFGILYGSLNFLGALDVVTFGLLSDKTLSLMIGHGATVSSDRWNTLDESYHGAITSGIK